MNLITQFGNLENAGTATLIVGLLVGICNCFFGYKLLKIWTTIAGMLLGGGLGYGVAREFTENIWVPYIALILAAAFMGLIAYHIYVIGVFLVCFLVGLLIACAILQPQTSGRFFICIAAGVVVGILGCTFVRPMVIISTSLQGGIGMGTGVIGLAKIADQNYAMFAALAFAALGIVVQMLTTKEKQEDTQNKRADKRRKK